METRTSKINPEQCEPGRKKSDQTGRAVIVESFPSSGRAIREMELVRPV